MGWMGWTTVDETRGGAVPFFFFFLSFFSFVACRTVRGMHVASRGVEGVD